MKPDIKGPATVLILLLYSIAAAVLLYLTSGQLMVIPLMLLVITSALAFDGLGLQERLKNLGDRKKPAFWAVTCAGVLCLAVTVFLFFGPPATAGDDPSEPAADFDWGITLTAEDVTSTGLTLRCTQSGGTVTGELSTGPYYHLEWYDHGVWVPMDKLVNAGFGQVLVPIPQNDTVTWEVYWAYQYGSLYPGQYRIVKFIDNRRSPKDCDRQEYGVEFTVAENAS